MGFDYGFDIYPRLEPSDSNKETYRQFLDEVIRTYEGVHDEAGRRADGKVLVMPPDSEFSKSYVRFMVGECPHMPYDPDRCDYFLRFSSKISGHLTFPAEKYITSVHEIAKRYFGSRVHLWHELWEMGDERLRNGCYGWQEVHDADRKLRELEAGQQEHALEEQAREATQPNTQ